MRNKRTQRQSRGFTLIELLVVVAIIGVISTIAVAGVTAAYKRAQINAIGAEGRTLFTAFTQFALDEGAYPYASTSPAFQLDTFEPLRSMGYYDGNVVSRLKGGQADAYDSPDDGGTNYEFWLVMSPKADADVKIVVADSDSVPGLSGEWISGVFVIQNGVARPLDDYEP